VLKGITAATTAELINKVDTITDEDRTVKDVFFSKKVTTQPIQQKRPENEGSPLVFGIFLQTMKF
jgi:hypothetical protein